MNHKEQQPTLQISILQKSRTDTLQSQQYQSAIISMFGCCSQCKISLEGLAQFYCCNQAQVFCSNCKNRECPQCRQLKSNIGNKKRSDSIKACDKCRQKYPDDQMFQKKYNLSFYCVKCLNQQFQNSDKKAMLGPEQISQMTKHLKDFCCFCFIKISERFIELKDGRKIDSICFESNPSSKIQFYLQTQVLTCAQCQIILGNSLYVSSMKRSQKSNTSNSNVCKRCEKGKKQQQTVSIRQVKNKPKGACFQCRDQFIQGTQIQPNVFICRGCQIQQNLVQNDRNRKKKQSQASSNIEAPSAKIKFEEKSTQQCVFCKKTFQPNNQFQKICKECHKNKSAPFKQEEKILSLQHHFSKQKNRKNQLTIFTSLSPEVFALEQEKNQPSFEMDTKMISLKQTHKKHSDFPAVDNYQEIMDQSIDKKELKALKINLKYQLSQYKKCNCCQCYLSTQTIYYYSNIAELSLSSNSSIKLMTIHKNKIEQYKQESKLKQYCVICMIQLRKSLEIAPKRAATAQKFAKRNSPPKLVQKKTDKLDSVYTNYYGNKNTIARNQHQKNSQILTSSYNLNRLRYQYELLKRRR